MLHSAFKRNGKKMNEKTKEIIELIAAFLVDTTGNEIFEKWKTKRKISKVLKEDRKNIERIFFTIKDSDLYNLVEEFIMYSAFKEVSFYSPMDLTIEQEEKLWIEFSNFIKKESKEKYVGYEYRNKIVRCINLHNKAINNIIIDDQGNLQMKLMQSQHQSVKNSLNYIINTLNTETKLQDKDDKLNFGVEQLEAIMKSYRFDINFLRKLQIICICGAIIILLLMSIAIPLSLKHGMNFTSMIIMCVFLFIVVLLFLIFWKYITGDLHNVEKQMESMRQQLWEIHYKIYEKKIDNEYNFNR